jgi:hypothetical protein
MSSNVSFIEPTTCVNANQRSVSFCLPAVVDCNVPPMGILAPCDELWNCNLSCQQDVKYYMPYVSGDLIQIQTRFYDTDNSVSGMTVDYATFFDNVSLCTPTQTITNLASFSTRQMMAFLDGKSYQIIEIDTALITDGAFHLSFEKDGVEVCSQHFQEVDCENTIQIKSGCSITDCFKNCYGVPDTYIGDLIEYDNTLRFYGSIGESGFGTEIFEVGKRKKGVIKTDYDIYFKGTIPPYVKDIVVSQMFACGTVEINGEEYEFDSLVVGDAIKVGSMWHFSITVYKECDSIINAGCD